MKTGRSRTIHNALGKKFIVYILIPFYMVVVFGLVFMSIYMKRSLDNELDYVMDQAQQLVEEELNGPASIVLNDVRLIMDDYIEPERQQGFLDRERYLYPSVKSILLLDENGTVILSTTNSSDKIGINYSNHLNYINVKVNQIYWSSYIVSKSSDELTFKISYRYDNDQVVFMEFSTSRLQNLMRKLSKQGLRDMAIVNGERQFIAHSNANETEDKYMESSLDVKSLFGGQKIIKYYEGVIKIISTRPVLDGNLSIVSYTTFSKHYNLVFFQGIISAILLACLTIITINYLFHNVRTIGEAIKYLVRRTGEVSGGNYEWDIEKQGFDELDELVHHFNMMSQTIERSMKALYNSNKEIDLVNQDLAKQIKLTKENESQIAMIMDNSYDGIMFSDLEDTIVRANKSLWDLFEIPVERVITFKKCYEIFKGLDSICPGCNKDAVLKTGHSQKKIIETDKKVIEEQTIPVFDEYDQVSGFVKTYRDITEQRIMEKKVNRSTKMEAIGRLTSGIAHDFNNILQVVVGYSELLQLQMEAQEDTIYLQKIKSIHDAALRAEGLIRKLMTFSKMDQINKMEIDLNETIIDIGKMLERIIGENIKLTLDLESGLSHIQADPTQMEQIVVNLCVNARDAIEGHGEIIIRTYTVLKKGGTFVGLSVSDNGTGMTEDVKEKIFEPFFTTKDIGQGTGLGLATVIGIIESHHGVVDVESQVGHGTTFHIVFPEARKVQSFAEQVKNRELELAFSNISVLIVEDDQTLLHEISRRLTGLGVRVHSSTDPVKAMTIYNQIYDEVDLVILDAVLPNISLETMMAHFRSFNYRIKVILTSSYGESDSLMLSQHYEKGVYRLSKPYSFSELVSFIGHVITE